jgi:hypothetical protein
VIICHEIRSGELTFLIRNIEVVIFCRRIERASGAWPMCQSPAESTVNLVAGSFDAKIPSAKGDLQIFPKQTKILQT